jgi:GWxTD domain-containing protein
LLAVAAAGGEGAVIARALADVQTALGDYREAETASFAGGSGPASLHARAVALLLQTGRESEGTAVYFRAVDELDAATAERLYRDLEAIARPNEAADWRVADVAGRRAWLHRFWSHRAAESGVTEAERLSEHYRRLAVARREYLRNSRRGVSGSGVLLSESWVDGSPFDDRGIILIRRGVPGQIVQTRMDGVLPNETWVYPDADGSGNVLFHFVALRGTRDYTLMSDLMQALDVKLDPVVDKARYDRAVLTLLEDRAAFEPGYQAAAGRLRSLLTSLPESEVRVRDATEIRSLVRRTTERVDADYRRAARLALAQDVQPARFDRPLDFLHDLFTFRAPFGRTDLTAVFALPAQGLAAEEESGRRVYPVALSVILVDTLTDAVTRRDTVQRVVTTEPLRAGDWLLVHLTLPVSPSEHSVYRVVARSPAVGSGSVYAGTRTLRDYSGMQLQVSDLVLAQPDSAGDWVRGDLRLALTLPRRFQPGRPFRLFYEIYNLERDAPYRTQLKVDPVEGGGAAGAVKRLFGGGPPRVDLRFEDVAVPGPDGAIREFRSLESDLPPGRYRMQVIVTHARTGARAESETLFEVIR